MMKLSVAICAALGATAIYGVARECLEQDDADKFDCAGRPLTAGERGFLSSEFGAKVASQEIVAYQCQKDHPEKDAEMKKTFGGRVYRLYFYGPSNLSQDYTTDNQRKMGLFGHETFHIAQKVLGIRCSNSDAHDYATPAAFRPLDTFGREQQAILYEHYINMYVHPDGRLSTKAASHEGRMVRRIVESGLPRRPIP